MNFNRKVEKIVTTETVTNCGKPIVFRLRDGVVNYNIENCGWGDIEYCEDLGTLNEFTPNEVCAIIALFQDD